MQANLKSQKRRRKTTLLGMNMENVSFPVSGVTSVPRAGIPISHAFVQLECRACKRDSRVSNGHECSLCRMRLLSVTVKVWCIVSVYKITEVNCKCIPGMH